MMISVGDLDILAQIIEFFLLINEIFSSLEEDPINLRTVFSTYILGIFHSMNLESQSNFYQCDKIKHNLSNIYLNYFNKVESPKCMLYYLNIFLILLSIMIFICILFNLWDLMCFEIKI